MLFRKKIERRCEYCEFATKLDDETMLCIRKGIVMCDGKCLRFLYDPCKRTPVRPKAVDFAKYDSNDYSL
jgi:hypothetical protein